MIDAQKDNKQINMSNESSATSKYIRLSAHKVRRILSQIRGKKYEDALIMLEFMPYRPCKTIKKILISAANNGINNYGYIKEKIIVTEACANKGPALKRFQPRAQGRAFRIHKPTCHITLKIAAKI